MQNGECKCQDGFFGDQCLFITCVYGIPTNEEKACICSPGYDVLLSTSSVCLGMALHSLLTQPSKLFVYGGLIYKVRPVNPSVSLLRDYFLEFGLVVAGLVTAFTGMNSHSPGWTWQMFWTIEVQLENANFTSSTFKVTLVRSFVQQTPAKSAEEPPPSYRCVVELSNSLRRN